MQLHLGTAGGHTGYIIENALSPEYMSALNTVRTSLPIDTTKKKTAAARRFFCTDGDDLDWIRVELVRVIQAGLKLKKKNNKKKYDANDDGGATIDRDERAADEQHAVAVHEKEKKVESESNNNDDQIMQSPAHPPAVQILPHMRFLEYTQPHKSLGPHTDALIRDKTTNEWSTHTLLVFCTDCKIGGETTLLPEDAKVTRMREKKLEKAQTVVEEVMDAVDRVVIEQQQGVNSSEVVDGGTDSIGDTIETTTTTSASASASTSTRLDRLQAALASAKNRVIQLQTEQSALSNQCFPVQPRIGRIFFFPHGCPHEGRPTVSVPKIFLRAELILRE